MFGFVIINQVLPEKKKKNMPDQKPGCHMKVY